MELQNRRENKKNFSIYKNIIQAKGTKTWENDTKLNGKSYDTLYGTFLKLQSVSFKQIYDDNSTHDRKKLQQYNSVGGLYQLLESRWQTNFNKHKIRRKLRKVLSCL